MTKQIGVERMTERADREDPCLDEYVAELCTAVTRVAKLPEMDISSVAAAQHAHRLISAHLLLVEEQRRVAHGLMRCALARTEPDTAQDEPVSSQPLCN